MNQHTSDDSDILSRPPFSSDVNSFAFSHARLSALFNTHQPCLSYTSNCEENTFLILIYFKNLKLKFQIFSNNNIEVA